MIVEVLKMIEAKGEIPVQLVDKNIQLSGIAMSTIFSPITHLKIDYNRICRNLGTIPSKEESIKLNYDIAYFIKNVLELDNLFKFLSICQIKINWDEMGKEKEIQAILKTRQTRETTRTLKTELVKYIDARNRIAHTGMSPSDITFPELKDSVKLISILSKFLKQKCEK